MSGLLFLIPVALFLGAIGLIGFLWTLRSGQYDDIEGASMRILENQYEDKPDFTDAAEDAEKPKD